MLELAPRGTTPVKVISLARSGDAGEIDGWIGGVGQVGCAGESAADDEGGSGGGAGWAGADGEGVSVCGGG